MIIDKIHVENFGKLSNLTLNFQKGINQIYEENGFGKTTLSIFFKSMFYGMPPARENLKMERKKYMPWQGGDFGGYIEFSTNKERFRLTRFFGKTPEGDNIQLLDLNSNTLVELPKIEIGEYFFGVGKETFEMTSFFPQNNFVSTANTQITANILGLDKLKYDLMNVNIAIDKIKKKESEIKRNKVSKEEIVKKQNILISLNNQLAQMQNDYEIIKKSNEVLQENLKVKRNSFDTLQTQFSVQQQLFDTKSKIEEELLSLTSQLNNLLATQEKETQSVEKNVKIKKMDSRKILFILLGAVFLITGIVLVSTKVIEPTWIIFTSIIGVGVIAMCLFIPVKEKTNNNDFVESDKQEENNQRINFIRDRISDLENSLKEYKNITNISELYYNERDELNKINLEIEKNAILQQNVIKEIDKTIENIDSLKDEIDKTKSFMKEIDFKLKVLSQTKEFIAQAQQNVSKRFVEPVNKAMNEIVKNFNLGDREFLIDANLDIKQMTEKGVKELDYSSQGIKDILSFCIRMFYINEIYKKEKPVLILDDTFVNLDDKNMQKAGDILNKFADNYQIIYLFCHTKSAIKKS